MLAAVFKRKDVLEVEDRQEPKNLAGDEALLEIEGAGRHMFPRSIAVLESGVLNLAPFISHEATIAELPAAIEEAHTGKAMKVLVLPNENN